MYPAVTPSRRILAFLLFCGAAYCQKPFFLQDGQRVLFLGDSITQNGRYVEQIEAVLMLRFAGSRFEITKLGLSSETVSGLTEAGHPYPRPNVHDRLGKALELARPNVVTACYGMNDGIYHPFSKERFQAYQDGIRKLIARVREAGAAIVLFTPPPFDPLPKKTAVGKDAARFGYQTPYKDYDSVLERYGRWLLTLRKEGIPVVDLHAPMLRHVRLAREKDPAFLLAADGVHPGPEGHWIMARAILEAWGLPDAAEPPAEVLQPVSERWKILGPSLLTAVGNPLPKAAKGLPLDEARAQAAQFETQAREAARRIAGRN